MGVASGPILDECRVVGQSITRVDGRPKVTGLAKYGADVKLPGMLHAKVLRSRYPHARILRIDAAAARKMPGVHAVLTHEDVPGARTFGKIIKDQPVLCWDVARYLGDPIAVVAAETVAQAEAALHRIVVDYEPLPVIAAPEDGLKPDAPPIHPRGNVMCHVKIRRGDVDDAFRQAAVVVEGTYRTGFAEHAAIEPEAGIAAIGPDGILTVWVSTQSPHNDRADVARCVGLPQHRVRIVQTATGGGFGGKVEINVHVHAALAAMRTGRPVRLVWTREENLIVSGKRHPYVMRYRTGADANGKLTALEAHVLSDQGAYASYGPAVMTRAAVHATGPYFVPNVRVDSIAVFTNNTWTCAMRGFGVPQVALAYEAQMDRLAEALGIDPVEFRLLNALRVGDATATGHVIAASAGLEQTLVAAREAAGWQTKVLP